MNLLVDRRQSVHLVGPRRHLHRRAEARCYGVHHPALLPRHLDARTVRSATRRGVKVTRPADRPVVFLGEQRATARKCRQVSVFCPSPRYSIYYLRRDRNSMVGGVSWSALPFCSSRREKLRPYKQQTSSYGGGRHRGQSSQIGKCHRQGQRGEATLHIRSTTQISG